MQVAPSSRERDLYYVQRFSSLHLDTIVFQEHVRAVFVHVRDEQKRSERDHGPTMLQSCETLGSSLGDGFGHAHQHDLTSAGEAL